uniref:Uncharacterized protein n=1 Tax=Anguilla anguilla TaxID=7936 RepID=A0A0E9Y124_ANGAN
MESCLKTPENKGAVPNSANNAHVPKHISSLPDHGATT